MQQSLFEMDSREADRPLSVVIGGDPLALRRLLAIHAPLSPAILDCTYNRGVMWRGLDYPVVTMDIDPQWETEIVGDFRAIPLPAASVDVIVFDPPHVPIASATAGVSQRGDMVEWRSRYGLTPDDDGRRGENVNPLFRPFLTEAARVLRRNGIVLAKLVDFVHNHRYQWQHVDFVQAAWDAGMTPCDLLLKVGDARGNLKSGRWEAVHHLRGAHTYWIVVRNGVRCEPAWRAAREG